MAKPTIKAVTLVKNTFRLLRMSRCIIGSTTRDSIMRKSVMNASASPNKLRTEGEVHPHVLPSVIAMRKDIKATENVEAPKTSGLEGVRIGDSLSLYTAKRVSAIAIGMTVWLRCTPAIVICDPCADDESYCRTGTEHCTHNPRRRWHPLRWKFVPDDGECEREHRQAHALKGPEYYERR